MKRYSLRTATTVAEAPLRWRGKSLRHEMVIPARGIREARVIHHISKDGASRLWQGKESQAATAATCPAIVDPANALRERVRMSLRRLTTSRSAVRIRQRRGVADADLSLKSSRRNSSGAAKAKEEEPRRPLCQKKPHAR